jgi:subtilisin family serine protease
MEIPHTRRTGRHLVLLDDAAAHVGAKQIQNATGLRIGHSSDQKRGVHGKHVAPGEGLLFERLGVVLVHPHPDQVEGLEAHGAKRSLLIEPERIVRATGLGNSTRVAPVGTAQVGVQMPGSGPFVDTPEAAWGLQATGVLSSPYAGRGIRVAILDTGMDLKHPDFVGRSVVSQSFVKDCPANDVNGHGTVCAGIACGPQNPSAQPRYGVAYACEIYVTKVLDDNAGGADGNILAGIEWAVANGCAVVSMSLGSPVVVGDSYSRIFEQVAVRAMSAGCLLLAAAGNESERPDKIVPVEHPANCPSILAVGAVDGRLAVAPFSNGGLNSDGGQVDLAAPGVVIFSSCPSPALYQRDNGTSMATPHVAGIAALLAEANPTVRGGALRDLLLKAISTLPLPAQDVGAGLVRAPQ